MLLVSFFLFLCFWFGSFPLLASLLFPVDVETLDSDGFVVVYESSVC